MRRSFWGIAGLAGSGAAGVAIYFLAQPGPGVLVVTAATVAAHALTVFGPSGRRSSLLPLAGSAAVIVTGADLWVVLGGAAIGIPVAWGLSRVAHGRRVTRNLFPADPLGLGVMAGLTWLAMSLLGRGGSHPDVLALSVGVAGSAMWFGTAVLVRAFQTSNRSSTLTAGLVRAAWDWPVYVSMFAAGSLFAATHYVLGWWAIPLSGLPYAFSHVSLGRLQRTRHTYRQTIKALGRVPEAGGIVADGHSSRCAELAVAVGAEVGIMGRDLERLEFAALLHDLGRVVLTNPAISQDDYSESDVAGWSAAIISEAKYLEPVSEIVADQHRPYRRPGEERDTQLSRSPQVVRTVARFDAAIGSGLSEIEALEVLHRGAAYDYDPEVVTALRTVLEKRRATAA